MVNNKIKAFLKRKEIKNVDFSKKLNLAKPQALNTKLIRNSFKIQDIIELADMGNCSVALIDNDTKEIITSFDKKDI